MTVGHVILLNGPSSAGKTSVARALQVIAGTTCVVLSIDQLFAGVHRERTNDWALFEALTRALAASAFSLAASGFLVVVDTVFERPECRAVFTDRPPRPVFLIGITCAIEVLEQREKQRADRPSGLARRQSGHVHEGCTYSLMIDTSDGSAAAHATRIFESLRTAIASTA